MIDASHYTDKDFKQRSLFALPMAIQRPLDFDLEGARILWRAVPVRFDDGLIVVTLDGVEHQFEHPIKDVLTKISNGKRVTAAWLKGNFRELELFDFINVFARGKYVLNALEAGCAPEELMAATLTEMEMASRMKDAQRRARAVQKLCRAIGRCGFASVIVRAN